MYECRNWETERCNSVLEITVSFLEIHKWEPDIYIRFSLALHLQCMGWLYSSIPVVHPWPWNSVLGLVILLFYRTWRSHTPTVQCCQKAESTAAYLKMRPNKNVVSRINMRPNLGRISQKEENVSRLFKNFSFLSLFPWQGNENNLYKTNLTLGWIRYVDLILISIGKNWKGNIYQTRGQILTEFFRPSRRKILKRDGNIVIFPGVRTIRVRSKDYHH